MAKKLSDVLAGTNKSRTRPGSTGTRPGIDYASKMKDERNFVASHEVQEFDDRVGNGSDVYNASNIKHNPDDRHGHIPKPEDEKQYKQANEQTMTSSPRPKPRPVFAEAKKEYEEDATDEKEMMMNQLNFIKLASEKIKGHINSTKDPEEWFQNKLSGLHANMKDLHAYVAGEKDEVKEEAELDEAQVKKPTSYERAVALPDGEPDKSAKMGVNKAAYAAASAVAKPKSKVSLKKAPWDMKKEEVEQIDELDKETYVSYTKKAAKDLSDKSYELGASKKPSANTMRKATNRLSGISKATSKLAKEEVEQIDELDKKTYGSYAKKAKDDLGKRESEITRNMFVDPKGVKDPIKHNNSLLMKRAKRRDYINTAIDKLTKEEVEGDPRVEPKDVKSKGKSLKMITGQVKESNHNGSRTKTGTEQARARFDKKMERKEMQKDQEDDN